MTPGTLPRRRLLVCTAAAVAILAVAAALLLAMGRTPWCRCGTIALWTGDAWGPQNSQQLSDPYTFTHITHGVLFYLLLHVLAPRWSVATRGVLAVGIESAWEVLENTNFVIDRYRTVTLALGYYGDSVFNSVGDVLACVLGFVLAARLPTRATCAMVVAIEIVLLLWVRDNLTLNLVMLAFPVDAIKQWQLGQ